MNKQILDISTSSIIRVFVVLLVIGFILAIWPILASVFFAAVIASALEPAVRLLTRIGVPRVLTAFILYAVGFLIFASVFYAVLPTLVSEVRQLSSDLPQKYSAFIKSIEQILGTTGISINVQDQIRTFFENIQSGISESVSNIFGFTSNVFGGLISALFVLVISFYLVLQKDGIEHFLKSFIPAAHQEYAMNLWQRIQARLGRWFQSQLLLGIFIGTFLFLGLWLMGVKYALTIAFMAGVLEIIPVIGPMIAGITAFALISFQSPALALGAILVYLLIEQIQQHLFVPIIVSKAIGLSPIVILVALLVAGKLLGFWGILLAIPLAVTIGEIVRDFRK